MACFGLVAGVFTSCDTDKTIEYQPAPQGKVQPAFFTLQPTRDVSLGDEDTEVTFNLYRGTVNDPATVDLSWEGDTQMFLSLPNVAVFEEDALLTTVTMELDPSSFEAMKEYDLKVTINGTETTPYSQNFINFAFTYYPMSPWEPFGADPALDRDGWGIYYFSLYYSGYSPVLVETRHSLIDEDQVEYRFQWYIDDDNPSLGMETFLTAASDDGGKSLYVPEQVFAYHPTYGDVYVMTAGDYNPAAASGDSYFDEVSGTFYLDVIYFVEAGIFGYGYETCTLFGYADTNDYTVTLTDGGTFSLDGNNYQLVNFSWTDAVAAVAYTVVDTASVTGEEGEIDQESVETLAQGMLTGAVQYTMVEDQGLQALTFPTGGNYTVVAGGFVSDANGNAELKSTATLSFKFVSPDPNEGWNSLGYVEYTDGYMCAGYLTGIVSYYVEVQESEDFDGYIRLVDPYGASYPLNEEGDWNPKLNAYLYIDMETPETVVVEYSEQNINWDNQGYLICYCLALNEIAGGATVNDVADLLGSYKDNVITFPFRSLMCSFDGGKQWSYANLAIDVDHYLETGEVDYMTDAQGNPIAPFKVDFNTLTDNPLADATRSVYSMNLRKAAKELSTGTTVTTPRHAKVVKYKGKKLNMGKRKAYRTPQPANF